MPKLEGNRQPDARCGCRACQGLCNIVTGTASQAAHLIDALAAVVCMHVCVGCAKVPPLKAIHWPEVTLFPAGQRLLHLDKLTSNCASTMCCCRC